MSLNFPNPSRSYDPAKHRICFWGYDNAREVAFLLNDDVLLQLNPGVKAEEAELLKAFDLHRDRILRLAGKLYTRGSQNSFIISSL